MATTISVLGYPTAEDRRQRTNAVALGDATTLKQFNDLVNKPGKYHLDYTDETGKSLYMHEVERRFGYYRPDRDDIELPLD